MLRLISAADRRALDRLLRTRPASPTPHSRAAWRRSSATCGAVATGPSSRMRKRFDKLTARSGSLAPGDGSRCAAMPAPGTARLGGRGTPHSSVARAQVPKRSRVTVAAGLVVEQRVMPLARVGCYVPGGRFPLPSSLLMTAIPATAGRASRRSIVCCPRPEPVVLAAALEAGVTRLFAVGGAHAVAAMAYGTATVPRVDKIVGPGNAWVAAAKALVARDCGIDFYAGPSEIRRRVRGGTSGLDCGGHAGAGGARSRCARDPAHVEEAAGAGRAPGESRRARPSTGVARTALSRRGRHRPDAEPARVDRARHVHRARTPGRGRGGRSATRIPTAGTTFVGEWSAQAAGDYATGSNHVLPTGGAARFRGGLSAADFVRVSSVQKLTRAGFARIAPTAIALADAEGLSAHAESMRLRLREATTGL